MAADINDPRSTVNPMKYRVQCSVNGNVLQTRFLAKAPFAVYPAGIILKSPKECLS